MAAKTEQETLLRMTNGAAIAVATLALLWMSLLGYVVVKGQDQRAQLRAEQHAVEVRFQRAQEAAHAESCRVRAAVQSVIAYVATIDTTHDPRVQEFVTHASGLLTDPTCP